MAEPADIRSAPPRPSGDGDGVAVRSAGETDASLVALIRLTLSPPRSDGPEVGGGRCEGGPAHRIGKFEVLGEIGRGGFGTVLLVRDPDLGRERALKLPNPETLDSPGALGRFLGEARLASRVDHPNVVRVYEAETAGVLPYIVMEYCPGGSLEEWLAARSGRGHLPPLWAAAIAAEIAEGVHQAHLAGLLHRDLKPGNILLEPVAREGSPDAPPFRPKIADFGLAKAHEPSVAGRPPTASGTPLGTWAYMSPEQARGEGGVRATTDVYSIGAILYELLAGERLYAGLGQAEFLGWLLGPDPVPSPGAARGGLPRDLETVCLKCLEKRPGDRYQNASELANDLRRFLAGLPILARPAPLWRRGLSRVKRRPARSALAGVAVASVVASGLAWSQFRELKRRGEIDVLLNRLETATIPQFPDLIPRIDPSDARAAGRLEGLFAGGTPPQKLAAAVVLAGSRPDCRTYSYEQLLEAAPREIPPLADTLRRRMPDLPARLAAEAETAEATGAPGPIAEAHDRRRAAAAVALLALGRDDRCWPLLRFSPDPQARSFLVHLLGPAGIDPRRIADRLDVEPDASARRSLILSLGEFPTLAGDDALRRRLVARLVDLYRSDPDAGVHGSAKWLLLRLGLKDELGRIDRTLAGRAAASPRPSWRISPSRLTLIAIGSPALDRTVEVSDTEITVGTYLEFRRDHAYVPEVSPGPDSPMNSVNYCDAAAFCNWLSAREQVPADQHCYRLVDAEKGLWAPVEGHRDRAGYRLPTVAEFEAACRSGTSTARFYGDSASLLPHYARYDQKRGLRSSPVAHHKPNDWGFFDVLGNAFEVCQSTHASANPRNQAALCGGCWANDDIDIKSSVRIEPTASKPPNLRGISDRFGFRVARTVGPGKEGP